MGLTYFGQDYKSLYTTSNQCPSTGSVSADCVLSFRVELTEEKDRKLCPVNGIQKESNKVTVYV